MRHTKILIPLLISNFSLGCDDSDDVTMVAISADQAPAFVAVRDGADGAWQEATKKTATSFEAAVRGPYTLTAVCEDAAGGTVTTLQLARTPEDGAVAIKCEGPSGAEHAITGRMVQAGSVQLGDAIDTSTAAAWDFELGAHSGTYDLLARAGDRIVLRRGIAITGDLAVTPALDVAVDGKDLAAVTLTATNAAAGETLTASVQLDKPRPLAPLAIYDGPLAAAKVAPEAALVATDVQSVAVQAGAGGAARSLRRPFRVGGDAAFTLPAGIDGARWEVAGGELSVSWSSVPAFDQLQISASGASAAMKSQRHELELSPRFVEQTGAKRATLDTDIPGYKAEWKVDLGRQHVRALRAQRTAGGELATSAVSEAFTPGS
jgi:hypothetical protein